MPDRVDKSGWRDYVAGERRLGERISDNQRLIIIIHTLGEIPLSFQCGRNGNIFQTIRFLNLHS